MTTINEGMTIMTGRKSSKHMRIFAQYNAPIPELDNGGVEGFVRRLVEYLNFEGFIYGNGELLVGYTDKDDNDKLVCLCKAQF